MLNAIKKSKLFKISAIICLKRNKNNINPLKKLLDKKTQIFFNGFPHKSNKIINFILRENIKMALCLGFPNLIRLSFLKLFKEGVLNFHPAYLPYNKGSHSAFWAIMNNTPYGASMHFMNGKFDSGEIVDRIKCKIDIQATADKVFEDSRKTCVKLIKKNIKNIYNNNFSKIKNRSSVIYFKKDISKFVNLNISQSLSVKKLWSLLRAVHYKDNGIFLKINDKKFKITSNIKEI